MEIDITTLLKGKATQIKGKEYFSTAAYVEPFLERMSKFTDDFRVQVKLADQISLTKEGEVNLEDTIFNRVWIQAVLPDKHCFDNNHQESINLLYALDTRKPVVKLFKNFLNMACLNMCVFNPSALQVTELEPETSINYKFINEVMELTDNTASILQSLSSKTLTKPEVFDTVGNWIDKCIKTKYDNGFGKVKLAESLPVEVYKSLFIDEKSSYFCESGESDYFNIFNAWTYPISNDKGKDLVNKFEKSYLVAKILELV